MPTFSNFYDDGNQKWSTKSNALTSNLPVAQEVVVTDPLTDLVGVDIKTNVQNVSVKILKSGQQIGHIELQQIATWDLIGNQIVIYSSDELPMTLTFINSDEAIIGDDRLTIAVNGGIIA